ncbi:hypothetical protein HanXRQr2_Chr13g0613141 [Helianthus annuus]|uniref:Uncharacterized protein n=2 Tax=Helianthus annuus TaxID=4232 RepID=A0A9K3ELI0_HELAN|nr:hypothetical protein HanXRQr2_Chr13g0613141 [Helianthus annuus]KAJ0499523.1 hypothetical protein HanHA89_Chr13g0535011 [Helianthus annuus]
MRNNGMMSEYLHECEILTLPEPGSDDWFISPDPVLEPVLSSRASSGSTASCVDVDRLTIACTATTEIVRKKRTSKFEIPANNPVETAVNRRKGLPRRSPLN